MGGLLGARRESGKRLRIAPGILEIPWEQGKRMRLCLQRPVGCLVGYLFCGKQRPVGCLSVSAATGGLPKILLAFCLGVFFPQDGCVSLFYFAFGCMVLGYLMYVCMRLASSREGIERTVGALLSSTSPPLDLVHPLGRLCYSLHFSTFHLAPALVMLGSYYLLCMSLSLVPGEAKTRRGAVLAC